VVGQISIAPVTLAGVQFTGLFSTQTSNGLSTSATSIINNSGASLSVDLQVSGTSFPALSSNNNFSAAGSGTFTLAQGSNLNLNYFIDAANSQGAQGTPGTKIASFSYSPTLVTDSFAHTTNGQFTANGPYSMTLEASFGLPARGSLTTFSETIETSPSAVPLPSTLTFFATGLAGMGLLGWRRKKNLGD
jgi:hypothetical protein